MGKVQTSEFSSGVVYILNPLDLNGECKRRVRQEGKEKRKKKKRGRW